MEFLKKINDYQIILGSQSPRRQHLLKEIGIDFEVKTTLDQDENYPPDLQKEEIPVYLAKLKSGRLMKELSVNPDFREDKMILITADTIVWLEDQVLGKPENAQDAFRILKMISGQKHTVYTAVCLKSLKKEKVFFVETNVYFRKLTDEEILFYIGKYQPYDKAGAYGAQEWIGYIGIEHIEGSYFNVMGLPVQKLYCELMEFVK